MTTKRSSSPKLVAYSDGGSRGNPGEAACAAIVQDADGNNLLRRAERIGKATNNVAEYRGVIMALELCQQLGAANVSLRIDSELIVKQLQGAYRVKHPDLKPLYERVRILKSSFPRCTVTHIPRAKNAEADKLVNAALDGKDIE